MTNATNEKTLPVHLERVFNCSPQRVFDAWLDASTLGRWLFATPDGKMRQVEIDARVGGALRVVEQRGDTLADHLGKYMEIEPPHRLVFCFRYVQAGETATPATRVEIDFVLHPEGCLLRLTHHIDAAWADYRERTREGWASILQGLAALLAHKIIH